ncbi:MAG: DUF2262 domain-containing protein [Cocleimonas sp.]
MFDKIQSKAFQKLNKLLPDLKIGEGIRLGGIYCSGSCKIDGRHLSFYARSVSEEFEESLELGLQVFQNLDKYTNKAQNKICEDLLPAYLENRVDDEPELTQEEFKKNLTLSSIGIYSGKVVSIGFSDNGMFGGHELDANSLDKGETFTETQ